MIAMPDAPPRLEIQGLTKSFPGVKALGDMALCVAPGEVHALLGENGAGKSTLLRVLSGVMVPDCAPGNGSHASSVHWAASSITTAPIWARTPVSNCRLAAAR